jgi:nucleoside-diphosphate-sugar epimerase
MKRISILGSGWLGLPLAHELQQAGYQIKTSTRSLKRLEQIQQEGIHTCLYDIEPASSDSIENDCDFLQADILIINITSKNIEAYKLLIDKIKASTISKVLFISSTSVYADSDNANPDPVVESDLSTLKPCPLLEIENLFLARDEFKTSIIRFAGLIGYQRHPGRFFIQKDEENHFICKPIRNPEGFVNMIHRDDCIGIIKAVIKLQSWGEIFNGCSSQHLTRRDFYNWAITDYCGEEKPAIKFLEAANSSFKIIENNKVKNILNYEFTQDDFFSLTFAVRT